MTTLRRKTKRKPIKNKSQYESCQYCLLRIGSFNRFIGVITYINFQSGDKYKKQVLSQAQQKYQNRTMPAKRGTIYDRNGNILQRANGRVWVVVLTVKLGNSDEDYLDPMQNALVTIFGLDEGELHQAYSSDKTRESQYQIVKKVSPWMIRKHSRITAAYQMIRK